MRALTALTLLLLAPAAASAQDFGARVTPSGIDQLTTVAMSHVPEELAIEPLDRELYDCPGDGAITAHVPETTIELGWHELELRTVDGALIVRTVLDVDVANTLTLDNPYACFGEAMCDLSASVRDLEVEVELAASTGPEGGIEFHGAEVALDLTAEDLDIDSENCLVGDVATWLFNAVESWALDLVMPRLESMLSERLSAALTELMGDTLGLTIERAGFSIEGWLESLDLSRSDGVTVGGDAMVTWTGPARWHEDAPDVDGPDGEPLPSRFGGQLQVAASDRLVNEALYEAWRGGMISRLLADNSQSIALGTDGVVQQIGLPEGTSIDIELDIERPLVASFGRVAPDVAEVQLRELHVMVSVVPPTGEASRFDLFVDGSAAAELTVDPAIGGLVLDLHDLQIARLELEAGNHQLEMDPARLRTFVCETVTPMLSDRLSGLPVAPALHPIAGTFLHVTALESEGGWQRVGVDMHLPDLSDIEPPDTSLVEPTNLLPAGTARFEVRGTDDSTPEPLLRYRAWLDGEPLGDGEPSSLREVRFDATDGDHVLEVAAVDLNGNEDPVPVIHGFVVDGTPPELTVTESPGAVVVEPNVRLRWQASDAQSAVVESRWILRAIAEDGSAQVVQESPFGADRGAVDIATTTLDGGDLYEVEIVVRDAAGNVTSQAFGFGLHPSLVSNGCAVSAGRTQAGPVAALALAFAALLFVRRRRVS